MRRLFRSDPGSIDVNHTLCKVQSAIVYGAAPALSAAAFSVVTRLWFLTFTVDKSKSLLLPNSKWLTIVSNGCLVYLINGNARLPADEFATHSLSIVAIVSAWSQVAPDLLVAGMGPIMFFIFGTQRDVLEFWHLKPRRQVSSRTQRSTPANTLTSVHAAGRSALGSSGPPYGSDAWDVERDLAQHGISRPTIIVSGGFKGKGSLVEDSDAEDIEMSDSKPSSRMDEEASHHTTEGIAVRTIKVWTYDPPNDGERPHGHAGHAPGLPTARSSSSDPEKGA
ncbi:hypothetical protein FRC00_010552 [Tulasnella sp. 408]|nr:hypothetical protein FRC00_010552 [Tulasnella sp. 408]